MTPDEVRTIIREELAFMIKQNKLVFDKPMQILGGNDITLGRDIGTRIGTATDQKLAFFGSTPIVKFPDGFLVQPTGGGGSLTDAIDDKCRASLSYVHQLLNDYGLAVYP